MKIEGEPIFYNINEINEDVFSINISETWFNIGNEGIDFKAYEDPKTIAIRFIAYWIAFNALYAKKVPVNVNLNKLIHF